MLLSSIWEGVTMLSSTELMLDYALPTVLLHLGNAYGSYGSAKLCSFTFLFWDIVFSALCFMCTSVCVYLRLRYNQYRIFLKELGLVSKFQIALFVLKCYAMRILKCCWYNVSFYQFVQHHVCYFLWSMKIPTQLFIYSC